MTKYGIIAFAFIFIITIGYFGNKFGYTVNGIEMGGVETERVTDFSDLTPVYLVNNENPYPGLLIYYTDGHGNYVCDPDGYRKPDTGISGTMRYLYNLMTFRIDDVPGWMGFIPYLLLIMVGMVVFGMIRGNE